MELTLSEGNYSLQIRVTDVLMVRTRDLANCGFSSKFIGLLKEGFPNPGNYVGDKAEIGMNT